MFLITRNQQDIEALKEEVKNKQNQFDNLVGNHKKKEPNVEISGNLEKDNNSKVQGDDPHKVFLKCDLCSYQCENTVTLKKHTNTKHRGQTNSSNTEKQINCDECGLAFISKKSLKTHKKRSHELIKCEKCELTFTQDKQLQNHMKEQHYIIKDNNDDPCKCTSETVCDECIDYWVRKGPNQ